MVSDMNDYQILERERQQLHDLIDRCGNEPLSNNELLEKSQKLDGLIALIQQEQKLKKNK